MAKKRVEYEIILDSGDAERKVTELNDAVDENSKRMQSTGEKTQGFGNELQNMAVKATAVVSVFKTLISVMDEYNRVQKGGEDSAVASGRRLAKIAQERGGVARARSDVAFLTRGTGLTQDEAIGLLDQAGDLGFSGQDQLDAARHAALASNILGMSDSRQVLDVGGQIAKSQGIDIGTAISKVRAVGDRAMSANLATLLQQADAAGIDSDAALALVGSLADSGQGAGAAGANASAFIQQLSSAGYKGSDLKEGYSFLERRGVQGVGKVSSGFDGFEEKLRQIKSARSGDVLGAANRALAEDVELSNIIAINTAEQEKEYIKQKQASTENALHRAEAHREIVGSGVFVETAYNVLNKAGVGGIAEDGSIREMRHREAQDTKLLNDIRDNTRRPMTNPTTVKREE